MRVLLTGSSSQLGQEIQNSKLFNKYTVTYTNSELLNLSDFKKVQTFISDIKPNIIINTAAYTNVDKAEEEKDEAYLINALAIENIAKLGVKWCDLSSKLESKLGYKDHTKIKKFMNKVKLLNEN